MEFKFKGEKSEAEILSDKVYAAMETGNPAQARLVLREHSEAFPVECTRIRHDVLKDYGVML